MLVIFYIRGRNKAQIKTLTCVPSMFIKMILSNLFISLFDNLHFPNIYISFNIKHFKAPIKNIVVQKLNQNVYCLIEPHSLSPEMLINELFNSTMTLRLQILV